MLLTRQIRTGIICSLALAFIVVVAIGLYADVPHMLLAFARFQWAFLPLILGLVLFNYSLRYVKWHYYLRRLNIRLHWLRSLLIFLSGLSMAITPGKVGELLKSYLLKRETGAPISQTSPVIMAERLTDGIAMLAFSMLGLVFFRFGWELLVLMFIVITGGILFIQNRHAALALLSFGERLPVISRIAHLIRAFYESSYTLLQWRPLLFAILIGFISWAGECVACYVVFIGLGIPPGATLLLKATFILAFSTLIGSATGLPGGLGTVDGAMLGLIRLLVTPSATIGGAATLLIRLCTLWFGLALGVVALLVFRFRAWSPQLASPTPTWKNDEARPSNFFTENLPAPDRRQDAQPASASAHTGESRL